MTASSSSSTAVPSALHASNAMMTPAAPHTPAVATLASLKRAAPEDDDDDDEGTGRRLGGMSSVDRPAKGLRHFSYKVCEKVRAAGATKHDEIADQLVREAREEGQADFDEKNIRRRVYDALNVLMALQVIAKDRKTIIWRGLPAEHHREFAVLRQQKAELEERIVRLRQQAEALRGTKVAMERLYRRNESDARRMSLPEQQKIALPFIVLSTKKDTSVDLEMSEDRREVFFNFSAPFQIHDDGEVLRMLGFFPAQAEVSNSASSSSSQPSSQSQPQQTQHLAGVSNGQYEIPAPATVPSSSSSSASSAQIPSSSSSSTSSVPSPLMPPPMVMTPMQAMAQPPSVPSSGYVQMNDGLLLPGGMPIGEAHDMGL
jgi:hypothetical protein